MSAIGARVGRETRQVDLHAIHALLDVRGSLGDAVGLAIDHRDEVGHVPHGLVYRLETRLGDPATLHSGPDFGGYQFSFPGQGGHSLSDLAGGGPCVVCKLFHFRCDNREASPRFPRSRGLDRGVECEHVGLVGDRLDAGRHLLDLAHRLGEARHPATQLNDQVGETAENTDRVLDRVTALPQFVARLLGEDACLIRRICHPGLVGEQSARHILKRIQNLEVR